MSSDETINTFRKFAPGCDLAFVPDALADFVRTRSESRMMVVPNGSIQSCSAQIVSLLPGCKRLRTTWCGSEAARRNGTTLIW